MLRRYDMPIHSVLYLCLPGCSCRSSWEMLAMIFVNQYTRSYVEAVFSVISFYKHGQTRLEGSMRLLPNPAISRDGCLLLIVCITIGGLRCGILMLRCWWLTLKWNCVRYGRIFFINSHRSWPTASPPPTVQLKTMRDPSLWSTRGYHDFYAIYGIMGLPPQALVQCPSEWQLGSGTQEMHRDRFDEWGLILRLPSLWAPLITTCLARVAAREDCVVHCKDLACPYVSRTINRE